MLNKKTGLRILTFSIYIFILEMFVRVFTNNPFIDYGTLRIAISSIIVSIILAWVGELLPRIVRNVMDVFFIVVLGIYEFAEFGLYNFIGFFMGIGNAEQGTKVTSYIMDFLSALKPEYWLLLFPVILFSIGFPLLNKRVSEINKHSNKFFMIGLLLFLCITYYVSIRSDLFQNELQAESNYSVWLYPENSNLAVNNYGVLMYGYADIKSTIFKTKIEDDDFFVGDEEEDLPSNGEIDYSRTIDDSAWIKLISNTTDSEMNSLNKYFINRTITPKNEMTGVFEGKNLIIILMESVNEISILNQNYFPTLYKMYHEGISFHNNYSPRNNCSTGNNEFTVLSSLFTINNTCTANTYASNTYFEGAFNVFNNASYSTSSYHDYTQKYYRRAKIHSGLGSNKFYSVTDLGIPYDEKYEEWPSDVDMFKNARDNYMNNDKFFAYFASVTTHQTYNVSSTMGDKYKDYFVGEGYSTTLSRYLSKMKTLDEALEELLNELNESGKLEDTVIALFGDHYPYGLTDSQINEFLTKNNSSYTISRNSTTNKNVDRTPMVIYNAGMEAKEVFKYTSIIDLLPTLLNMFNLDYDPRLYLGTDVFSNDYVSRTVFADGSWINEFGYYHAPTNKMTYFDKEVVYTNEELRDINKEISKRQKMSASAIKSNYFNYLGKGLKKYEVKISVESEE